MENGEHCEGKGKTRVSRNHYREEIKKAAKDSSGFQDAKNVMYDFVSIDEEVLNASADGDLSRNNDKPAYRRDERGIFRVYPDGRKKYVREKRFKIPGEAHWNPPLEEVRRTVKRAIAEAHEKGIATVHCDKRGRVYLRYPDGRKEYLKSYMRQRKGEKETQRRVTPEEED